MPTISTFHSWRQDLADRFETAGGVLGSILATDGIQPKYVVRIEHAKELLLDTAKELRAARQPTSVLTLAEVVRRIHHAVRRLRLVVNWHGATETALEDLAIVLDDLDAAIAEADTLAGIHAPAEARAHA
jgi:hypothetical protein